MFKIQENPPFLFPFSFSFPTGKLKLQRTYICQIHFHLKIRYLSATLFLLSHSRKINQISRGLTYAHNLYYNLKWEKTFSIFRFFIMFPLNSLSVCLFHVYGLPTLHSVAAVCRHRPQLLYATKTTTDTTIVINPSQLRTNWQSSPSAAIVF